MSSGKLTLISIINDQQISDRTCRDAWRVDLGQALSTVILEVSRLRLQVLTSTLNMTHSKRDHGSLFTCDTSRYTMTSTFTDVQNTCVHNKPNTVTVPVMDQDEYQLHHAICKDTVPSVNEKPVTHCRELWSETNTWIILTVLLSVTAVFIARDDNRLQNFQARVLLSQDARRRQQVPSYAW